MTFLDIELLENTDTDIFDNFISSFTHLFFLLDNLSNEMTIIMKLKNLKKLCVILTFGIESHKKIISHISLKISYNIFLYCQ